MGVGTRPHGMPEQKKKDSGPNWRLGKFHDDNDEDQYHTEQSEIANTLANEIKIETKTSKHSKRRAKKKAKAEIVCNADPALNDQD